MSHTVTLYHFHCLDCGQPTPISNGDVGVAPHHGTYYGKQAIYWCDYGYFVNGTFTLTCNVSGLWDPEAPSCTPYGKKDFKCNSYG